MTTQNDVLQTGGKNQSTENVRPTSWFSKIIEKIQSLDATFPLSGAENEQSAKSYRSFENQ